MTPNGRLALRALACIGILAGLLGAQTTLTDSGLSLTVTDFGVVHRFPADGLETMQEPRVLLSRDASEWAGVRFREGRRQVAAVATGRTADWTSRSPVELVSVSTALKAHDEGVISVSRIGALELQTELRIDPVGPFLLLAVKLTNVGDRELRDIVYTREWLEPGKEGWTHPRTLPDLPPTPPGVFRRAWDVGDLAPGEWSKFAYGYMPPGTELTNITSADVPLVLWTDPTFPNGIVFGETNGVSWGDMDIDGYPDLVVPQEGVLWRNGNGVTWELAADLDLVLPASDRRYGAGVADYDNDGLPDIAIEPRATATGGNKCFHLLRNLGGLTPTFLDVATDPFILDLQPCGDAETICWGDVDGDGNIDLFIPFYPPWAFSGVNGRGNAFFRNKGPTGAGADYTFEDQTVSSGLGNPVNTSRPEGAMMLDVDADGDLDIFCNGTLYQNNSTLGQPLFAPLTEGESGIGFRDRLEEGAHFFDYDLDGDWDLVIAYVENSLGIRIWENLGDGTFFNAETDVLEDFTKGLQLGMSVADWDNDGDMDLTTRQVFRRNMLVETGQPYLALASKAILPCDVITATPAWADWDLDGDLDSAIGNWFVEGKFFENVLYDENTPLEDRRYVRLRVVRDSALRGDGLETEFGAVAELFIVGDTSGLRRRQFTSTAAGYINQNEYALTFGLPPDPTPGGPVQDLSFDLVVDFPSLPESGLWRVDKRVNPALGAIHLADLTDREITVFRSGVVRIDGVDHQPSVMVSPRTVTAGDGLLKTAAGAPLPPPVPSPTSNRFVGLDFTVAPDADLRIKEILLDGQLDTAVQCSANAIFNLALWDITNPADPRLVDGSTMTETTSTRNDRTSIPADVAISPGRNYRLIARVTSRRATPIAAPIDQRLLTVNGGLDYEDGNPCMPQNMAAATLDPGSMYLSIRVGHENAERWADLGSGKPGTGGVVPALVGSGTLSPGSENFLDLTGAFPNSAATLFVGIEAVYVPFKFGTLVPDPLIAVTVPTDALGSAQVSFALPVDLPASVPAGTEVYFQEWIVDPGATLGLSASNGVQGNVP